MENVNSEVTVTEAIRAMYKSVRAWIRWHGPLFLVLCFILVALTVFPIIGGTMLTLEVAQDYFRSVLARQTATIAVVTIGVTLALIVSAVCANTLVYAWRLFWKLKKGGLPAKYGLDWCVYAALALHVIAVIPGLTAKGVNFFGLESPDQLVVREVKEKWAEVTGQNKTVVGIHPLVAFRYDELTRDKVSLQRAYAQVMNWGDALNEAAKAHQLPVALLAAVMHIESSGRPEVCSGAGACGLMGLMPVVAGDANVFDPQQNVLAGAKYLASLIRDKGDVVKALAFYNARHALIATAYVKASLAGADSLTALALTPEVQEYVINVLAYEQAFAELGTSRNGRPQSYGEKYGGDKSATTHTVKSGDTCDGLAQENGITTGCLMEANDIADCQRDLKAGIKIKIPPRKDCV